MRHIVICGLSGSIFFHVISYAAKIFGGKKKLLGIKYVYDFCLKVQEELSDI